MFVSRRIAPGPRRQVPGFGPGGRTLAPGGRLLVRERDGSVRSLLPGGALYDVSDPGVSWDARRIVFAGLAHPDSAWRLFVVGADGRGLRQLTRSDRRLDLSPLGPSASVRFARYDDFDPCWLPDGRIVFASTRFPQVSQEGGLPVSNLFVVRPDGGGLERITTERNGAEEPTIDPRTGRIVYARWFFNPYLPSDHDPWGLTTDRARALPIDVVDHWQVVSIFPDGDRIQLAAGDPARRLRIGGYQPCVLRDGTVVGVDATRSSLVPDPGATTLVACEGGIGPVRYLTDTADPVDAGAATSRPLGVAAPAILPDGRLVFASDQGGEWFGRGAGGDFGLYRMAARAGARIERILDLPGTDELDPAPLVRRPRPPVLGPQGGVDDPAWTLPVTRLDQVRRGDDTFRFDCLNVFATGPVDSPFPDAPRIATGARIRFFATLARPEAATGDTVVLVREAKLDASGAVHESDIPGDVPMFEQLVDDLGHVLRSARGPAHVPGSNFARTGSGTKCVGCHEGHSALPVPRNNLEAKWFNASPSALVTVSGGSGGAALVDRRAKGPIRATGWVSEGSERPWARLSWAAPIEGKAVVLYAPTKDGAAGTDLEIRGCLVLLLRDGREVGRIPAGPIRPAGTRIEFPPVRIDAIEVRDFRIQGAVERRPLIALAEIETIARLIE
ncbi:MAG: hypothetical protein ABI960_07500 [Candidatus Eisenbacteria bacterium]